MDGNKLQKFENRVIRKGKAGQDREDRRDRNRVTTDNNREKQERKRDMKRRQDRQSTEM